MPRPGRTSQRGYGRPHRRRREQLLAAHIDGTPCDHCGQPMLRAQGLQADHSHPRALTDGLPDRLLHASCNASRGATFGNRYRRSASYRCKPTQPPQWLNQLDP